MFLSSKVRGFMHLRVMVQIRNKINLDGLVKSPYAALRCILRHCGVQLSTPHSSEFARLAYGAFYETVCFSIFYKFINLCFCLLFSVLCCLNIVSASNEKSAPPSPPVAKEVAPARKQGDVSIEEKLKGALQYLQSKNYMKAQESYRSIYISSPKGPISEKALFGMGKADYYLKHYNEARMNLQRLTSLYRESEHLNEAYLLLGRTSVSLQKYDEARKFFGMVGGTLKEKANIGEASLALRLGDVAKAESLLANVNKKVLETDPEGLGVRALIFSNKGKHNEAITAINKISEPMLKELDLWDNKAEIYYNAGKIKEAERICKDIIAKPTSNTEKFRAKLILLGIYEVEGKTDDMLKLSIELASSERGDDLKFKIVSLYDKKGDFESALRYLAYVKDKALRSAEITKRLKSIVASKDPKATEYILKYSQYISPENPFIAEASAYLIANGKKQEGIALLKKTKGISGGESAIYLSELLIGEGKYAEAKKLLENMTFDMRYIARVSTLMTEIMEKEGNYSTAIEYLKKVLKLSKDSRVYSMLGNLYWRTGEKANAAKFYVMASDMGDGVSSVKAGDCFYIMGEKKKAEIYYKKALNQKIKEGKDLQWARYQYGKLTGNRDYLQKATEGGGEIASAAEIMLGEK